MDGKQNTPKLVRDLMTVGVETCAPQAPLRELARRFLDNDLEGVVVLDEEGHSVGVVTRDELVKGYGHPRAESLTAGDVMREDVPELPPDIPLVVAAQLMQDMGVRIVFLLHHDMGIAWPAAILSYNHILRHLAAQTAEDLRDLGITAERQPPAEEFKNRRDAARRKNINSYQE